MSRPSNTRQAYPCATPVYPRPIEDVAGGGDHHTCLQHSVLHRTLPVEGKAGAGARAESTLMRTTLSTQQRLLRSGGGGGATPGPVVLRGGAGAPAVRQCTADQARVAEDLARLRRVAAGGAAVRRVVPCLHAQQQLHPHPHHGHCQQRLQRTAAVSAARLSKMLTEGGGVLDESGGGVGGAGAVSDDGSGDEVDVDGSAGAAAGAPAGPLPAYRPPLLVRMEGELCRALGEVNTRHRGQPYLLPASAVETRGTSAAPAPAGRKRGESGGGDGDGGVVGYRRGRLAAFRRVMRRFQRNFKSYRPILAATFAEYDGAVAAFCAERAADEARLARRAAEVAGLEERLAEAEAAATVELRVKKRELVAGQRALARARAEAAEADGAAAALARRAEAAEAHAAEVEEEKAVFQERCLQLERRVLAMQSEHSADLTARQCGAVEKATRDAQAAEEQAENLARENKALAGKVLALEAVQANMVSERDLLVDSSVRTPRPDWHESPIADCFTYTDSTQSTVFAAAEQVLELEHQLLELRQSEALFTRKWFVGFGGGKGDTNGGGAAAADGAASSSPAFLHHSGRLRNMNLRKPAVEQLVVQFWRERHTALGERRLLSPGEFLLDFLERKHGAGRAMEWAYNVWYGLQRYRADPDCDLFFGILSGRVAEGVWAEERLQLDKLRDALIDLDSANRGVLTPAQIIQAVGDVFPGKSEQSLRALRALVGAGGCGEVAYITLFDDDDECFQAPVVEALRRQNTAEREEYVRELLDAVLSIARRQGAAEITRGVVLAAFSTVDPGIPEAVLHDTVNKIFKGVVSFPAPSGVSDARRDTLLLPQLPPQRQRGSSAASKQLSPPPPAAEVDEPAAAAAKDAADAAGGGGGGGGGGCGAESSAAVAANAREVEEEDGRCLEVLLCRLGTAVLKRYTRPQQVAAAASAAAAAAGGSTSQPSSPTTPPSEAATQQEPQSPRTATSGAGGGAAFPRSGSCAPSSSAGLPRGGSRRQQVT